MNETSKYEPQIIAFCCMHCAYAAADLAGSSRITYPSSLKIVAIPCTGRTDMGHMLKTFEGVMIKLLDDEKVNEIYEQLF